MSTRMYNYRIGKERWWEFANKCRAYYMSSHPLATLVDSVSKKTPNEILDVMDKMSTFIRDTELTCDLQLFDEGDTYIVRPLENGYFFMNNHTRWTEFGLEPVFYDDRSDVPAEQEKNREVSLWCDERIHASEYLVFPLFSEDMLISRMLDALIPTSR